MNMIHLERQVLDTLSKDPNAENATVKSALFAMNNTLRQFEEMEKEPHADDDFALSLGHMIACVAVLAEMQDGTLNSCLENYYRWLKHNPTHFSISEG